MIDKHDKRLEIENKLYDVQQLYEVDFVKKISWSGEIRGNFLCSVHVVLEGGEKTVEKIKSCFGSVKNIKISSHFDIKGLLLSFYYVEK